MIEKIHSSGIYEFEIELPDGSRTKRQVMAADEEEAKEKVRWMFDKKMETEMDDENCQHCDANDWEYHESKPDRNDEPGHGAYWECRKCGKAIPFEEGE